MRVFWAFVLLALPVSEAILRFKLQRWFPKYQQHWIEGSKSCQQELTNYLNNAKTPICPSPCACVVDCLLENATGTIQSNFASAQVLLGLVPPVLVYFGPSLAEVAVLSSYKPMLAILIAFGSPAISLGRLFRNVDVLEPLTWQRSKISLSWSSWFIRQKPAYRLLLQSLSYVGAFGAIANNVWNSIYTDLRTVSGWRCGALFMPLVWSLLAGVVHAWGMVAIRTRTFVDNKTNKNRSTRAQIKPALFWRLQTSKESILQESLLWIASCFAILHMIYGILELSSLIFISALEALQVFVTYAASAFLCQLILLLEIANMRHELEAGKISPSS